MTWNRPGTTIEGQDMPAITTTESPEARPSSFVPRITLEELARRNAAAIALLDAWEADESSEQDQRETMDSLRQALGPDQIGSTRPAILP